MPCRLRRRCRFDPEHAGRDYFQGLVGAQHRFREATQYWARVIDLEPAGEFARRARRESRTAIDLQHIFSSRGGA